MANLDISIRKEYMVLKSFGFLDIIKISHKKQEKIEVQYNDRTIHDDHSKKTNLFYLFLPSLILGNKLSIYNICDAFVRLTTDIFDCFENIVAEFKGSQKTTPEEIYYIWALYDIFSTILDCFLSFYDHSESENTIGNSNIEESEKNNLENVNAIRKKYAILKNKVETPYRDELNKLKFEEECEINKALGIDENSIYNIFGNTNIGNSYDAFLGINDLYSYIEGSDIDMTFEEKIQPLIQNFNKIAAIIENYKFLHDIIQNAQPSMENFFLCRLFLDFPSFIKHYKILIAENIIEVESYHLKWTKSKASFIEYFNFIYKKRNEEIETEPTMSWITLESIFLDNKNNAMKGLKTQKGTAINTRDFKIIQKLLNLPTT
ncbi:hypothetical protein AGMMS49546_16710 [Spirochaetia bacterium]|nr:hypothetical protein AGMMS49546_16710 [Spirochaetia bacterium]